MLPIINVFGTQKVGKLRRDKHSRIRCDAGNLRVVVRKMLGKLRGILYRLKSGGSVEQIEVRTRSPVVTFYQAMIWRCLRQLRSTDGLVGFGQIFRHKLHNRIVNK